jgi:hypothetical protein
MSTKLVEVFEWYQMNIFIDESITLYHKGFFMVCNN